MWKMKRYSALFFSRNNAFSKRHLSINRSSANNMAIDDDGAADHKSKSFTNKPGLLHQVFRKYPCFTCGVAVGAFAVTTGKLLYAVGILAVTTGTMLFVDQDKLKFEEWMFKHGREYKDENEKQKRFLAFQNKLRYIEAHNSDKTKSFTVGLNNYSDWTEDEWNQFQHRGLKSEKVSLREVASKP